MEENIILENNTEQTEISDVQEQITDEAPTDVQEQANNEAPTDVQEQPADEAQTDVQEQPADEAQTDVQEQPADEAQTDVQVQAADEALTGTQTENADETQADNTLAIEEEGEVKTQESINVFVKPEEFVNNLGVMGKGMLGIFVVIGIIIAAVYAIGGLGKKDK